MDKDTNQITEPMSKLYQNSTLLRFSKYDDKRIVNMYLLLIGGLSFFED